MTASFRIDTVFGQILLCTSLDSVSCRVKLLLNIVLVLHEGGIGNDSEKIFISYSLWLANCSQKLFLSEISYSEFGFIQKLSPVLNLDSLLFI